MEHTYIVVDDIKPQIITQFKHIEIISGLLSEIFISFTLKKKCVPLWPNFDLCVPLNINMVLDSMEICVRH